MWEDCLELAKQVIELSIYVARYTCDQLPQVPSASHALRFSLRPDA